MQVFWDSDVGKWIEAASYALLAPPRCRHRGQDRERSSTTSRRRQAPDGYLNCWYLQREPEKRWTNLRDNHELYNLGHLLEGAIAYFRPPAGAGCFPSWSAMSTTCAETFGPGAGQKRGYCGHQEIELALIRSIA